MYFYLIYTADKSCISMEHEDRHRLPHRLHRAQLLRLRRGEIVRDPDQIAIRYLRNDFIIDLAAMLPIPQVIIWFIIPAVSNCSANHTNNTLSMIVLIQYIPRVFIIVSLNSKIVKTSGVVTRTAWAGAAYNLLLYTLASHVLGALWYLLSIERQYTCWVEVCTACSMILSNSDLYDAIPWYNS
ncbi:hypothetical protein GUJ93_ZPchr0421g29177 [Zizania palustris]|uniref:Ion transport domain-containing protein n=1 Tax=Zizania palustris TaxID=103762 RepID=A0A8J5R517_ZIZPA|nr:hypothetical protein GUJ93_ZPchr0421g29177 [Zizania palustris]